ncbi:MAG: hypothetical protein AVDCRST_MAG40-2156 [uncultured Gemmatimonadaceae bacterium]|uniref:Nitrate/nitrite response regulator protein n=1 Tax=uncultured Gemmatimonadaceae bacterium TaxID=246130 RepID=A0A6J4LMN3_9BACT|nr:MAG: hypothetical protein AVDCRST_MAG40-2156 [uncultured Gemmatimonadaceae bacterium]
MGEPLRLLLVDDHAMFRRGLREVLEEDPGLRVVAEAGDGEAGVERARALWPGGLDLVLMDIEMPRLDGIGAAKRILDELRGLPVVMLSALVDDDALLAAVRAGAVGFLSKSVSPDAMVRALRDYHRDGALPMSRTMAARALAHLQAAVAAPAPRESAPAPALAALTPREREVLGLVAEGLRDREIAARLSLSEGTVQVHVKNLLRKLGVRSRNVAAAYVRRGG